MAAYEFWVDPVSGNNANAGTEVAPFATIRYAFDSGKSGAWAANDTMICNVVPSGPLQSGDHFRIDSDWQGATATIKSTTPGVNFVVNDACDVFCYFINDARVVLRIQDCTVTCNRSIFYAGAVSAGYNTSVTIAGNCEFIHARTDAEYAIHMRNGTGVTPGRLIIESGCKITGWSQWIYCFNNPTTGALDYCELDGLIVDGTISSLGTAPAILGASDLTVRNCSISMPATTVTVLELVNSGGGSVRQSTIENNTFLINCTNTAGTLVLNSTGTNGAPSTLVFRNNSVTGTSAGAMVRVGRNINTGNSRATNNAQGLNFSSCLIENNDIINTANAGGVLFCMANSDLATVRNNYLRQGALGDTTDVHQVYMWGDGIRFELNLCQSSILAFGPNQQYLNNFIVAKRCLLLGGTQGGSTTSGGGNNYTIKNNLLIAFDDDCYSDYAFNGAYQTNLGPLVADINYNQYVVLSGADGIARLITGAGLLATTMTQLLNLWQNSALTGSGSVWGDASNADNDSHSRLEDGSKLSALVVQSAALSRSQLQSIKDSYRVVLKVGNSEILKMYKGSIELPKIAWGANRKWLS